MRKSQDSFWPDDADDEPPIPSDDLRVYELPSEHRQPPARRAGIWILVAFLLVVLAAAGGGFWLLGGGRLAGLPGLGGDTLHDVRLTDVTAGNGMLVAAGESSAGLGTHPVFLFSTDRGKTWHRAKVQGGTGQDISAHVRKVVATDGRWVALGVTQSGPPVLWTSRDGQTWHRTPSDPNAAQAFSETDHISGVAWTSSGYVLAGTQGGGKNYSPVIWTPKNDRSWRRHDGSRLGFLDGGTSAMPLSVAAHGDVIVVEISVRQGEKYSGSSYWRSTDGGKTWQNLGSSPKATRKYFPASDIVSKPNYGLVAFGSEGASLRLFRWKEGTTWSPLGTLPSFPDAGKVSIPVVRHLSASDAGYVALVKDGSKERLSFFYSADGRDWSSGGGDTTFELPGKLTLASAVAATDKTVVATVNRGNDQGGGAQIYVAAKGSKPEPADLPQPRQQ